MEIKSYKCNYCGSIFEKKHTAVACTEMCENKINQKKLVEVENRTRAEVRDRIRLNLKDINALPLEIARFIKEEFGQNIVIQTEYGFYFGNNIGSSYEHPLNKSNNRAGWNARLLGKFKSPLKSKLFGEYRSMCDVVWRSISGINTGCAGGGDDFYVEIHLFIEDFPELKKQHEKFMRLCDKRKRFEEIFLRLKEEAEDRLVDRDGEIKSIKGARDFLSYKLSQADDALVHRMAEIRGSEKWKKAVEVPKELHYDAEEYSRLQQIFK